MNYELWFFILLAFVVGKISANFSIYIGHDEAKYNNATLGILLDKK